MTILDKFSVGDPITIYGTLTQHKNFPTKTGGEFHIFTIMHIGEVITCTTFTNKGYVFAVDIGMDVQVDGVVEVYSGKKQIKFDPPDNIYQLKTVPNLTDDPIPTKVVTADDYSVDKWDKLIECLKDLASAIREGYEK